MAGSGVSWYAAFEQRLLCRMKPSERAAVLDIDRAIRRHWQRLAIYGALLVAFVTSGLYESASGKLTLIESAGAAFGILMTIPMVVIGAWARPASYASKPVRTGFAIVLLAVTGGFFGAFFAKPEGFATFVARLGEIAPRVVFATASLGLLYAALATGLGYLRQREVLATEARVRAEAEAGLREEQLAHRLADARLAALQAQVEPHFLFNSLAAVVELAEAGAPRAAELCQHLVQFLRSSLTGLRADGTTLGEDVDLASAYLEVMAIRMGDRLRWAIDVPDDLRAASLPAAMVISLVENAIKHGVEPHASPAVVAIAARRVDGALEITVDDTGSGLSEPVVEGLGLANIRERLRLQFRGDADLALAPHRPRGTRAVLRLPFVVGASA